MFLEERRTMKLKAAGKRKITEISSDVEILSDSIATDSDEDSVPRNIMSLSSKERLFLRI